MKLGFIGLGNMGLPMAENLIKAGYEVHGMNRSKTKESSFRAKGGKTGAGIAELAQTVDILMTCLPLPKDVENVYFESDGILLNGHEGLIVLDFSTVSPDLNEKVYVQAAKKGIKYLDAPISGGTTGAESGTLSIMVGGSKEAYEQVFPILEVLGENIYHTGDIGSGSAIKLINQYMVGIHTQATAEALIMGEEMGVDSDLLFEILNSSFGQSRILERHYTQFVAQGQFQAGFALKLLLKDLNLANEMNKSRELSLPLGDSVVQIIKTAANNEEFENLDMSAMYKFHKENKGKEVTSF